MGVIASANALFAIALSRFIPALLATLLAAALYALSVPRFVAQMRDRPRPRWITLVLDLPLFAHFGASAFALLAAPLCVALALLSAGFRGSAGAGWRAFQHAVGYAYGAGTLLAVWAIWIERRWVRVRRLTIAVENLPLEFDGYRIAQLSDLHVGSFDSKARARQWVQQSNALAPDLAVVTGDLVTSGTGFYQDVAEALSELRARDGVFVCMGNHDQADNEQLTRCVSALGPTVLRNATHVIHRGPAALCVAGIDGRIASFGDVKRTLARCEAGAKVVLLSHYPWTFQAAVEAGVDVMLTGHTHGGQLGVPFLSQRFNLARLTGQRSRGLVRSGKTCMYVNAGLGTTGPPMRLGVPPEIALITLIRAPEPG